MGIFSRGELPTHYTSVGFLNCFPFRPHFVLQSTITAPEEPDAASIFGNHLQGLKKEKSDSGKSGESGFQGFGNDFGGPSRKEDSSSEGFGDLLSGLKVSDKPSAKYEGFGGNSSREAGSSVTIGKRTGAKFEVNLFSRR